MKNDIEILRLENVSKAFDMKADGVLRAVNGVSLTIHQGECVGIVGESGCGKSTLARLVSRIETVTDGEIYFCGREIKNICGEDLKIYRRNMQMVFQNPSSVFSPRMKIGAFLMEPWRNFEKKSRKEAKTSAFYSLERVHLGREYFEKFPHQLSGGELQRIAIARAIALHPKLLICDEATSALDVSIQNEIIGLLKEHQEEAAFSIMFISHDLALTEDFCDRIAVMYMGRIVEIMPGKSLRKNARHPYTKALLASVFSIHDDPKKEIKVLQGEPPSPLKLMEGCAFCARCEYAKEICRKSIPELKEIESGHAVACFRE